MEVVGASQGMEMKRKWISLIAGLLFVALVFFLGVSLPKEVQPKKTTEVANSHGFTLPAKSTLWESVLQAHSLLSHQSLDTSGFGNLDLAFQENRPQSAAEFKALLFDSLGLQFDPQKNQFTSINPFSALRNKKGTCMGTSTLALFLAEKHNLPLKGVSLPGHFFLRWETGSESVNLEPNRGGYSYTNEEYLAKYNVQDSSLWKMNSLSPLESFAYYLYTIGTAFYHQGLFVEARSWLENAVEREPNLVEARGNLALSLRKLGYIQRGVDELEKANQIAPGDLKIIRYLARFYYEAKRHKEAFALCKKLESLNALTLEDRALQKKLATKVNSGGLLFFD